MCQYDNMTVADRSYQCGNSSCHKLIHWLGDFKSRNNTNFNNNYDCDCHDNHCYHEQHY